MSDRAVIEAELQGAGKVAADAKKMKGALADAKKEGEGAKQAGAGAAGEVRGLGQQVDALRSGLNPQAILGGFLGGAVVQGLSSLVGYLGQAGDKAKEFGEQTSATARRAGVDVDKLRGSYLANELATLQSRDAQDALVQEVEKLNYGGRGAAASLEGLGKIATSSGRSVREYAPLVASLQDGLGIVGDVSGEVERLIAEAQRLNVIGGPQAFLDTVAAIRPALQQINSDVDESGRKFLAFTAQLSSRLRPEQARSVASGAEGAIRGRLLDVERVLGRQVLGEDGKIKDPVRVLEELRARAFKMNGGNKAYARAGLIKAFGPDLGQQIYSTDFAKVRDDAARSDRAATQESFDAFLATDEGKRAAREAKSSQREIAAGTGVLSLEDAAGEAKEQAIDSLRESYQQATTMTPPARAFGPAGDPLTPDLQQLGQGGGLKLEFPAGLAKEIGKETAAALRAQPPTVKLPLQMTTDPNAPKGN